MAVKKAKKVKISVGDVNLQKRRGHNPDPKWTDWETMTGAEYHKHRRLATSYYYQEYKTADLLPDLYGWMKENKYNDDDIKHVKILNGFNLTQAAIVARLLRTGMPDLNPKEVEYWVSLPGTSDYMDPASKYLTDRIGEAIERGKTFKEPEAEDSEAKAATVQPSIQERLRDSALGMTDDIEEAHESFLTNPESFDNKQYKFFNILKGRGAKAAHARIIKEFYVRQAEEIKEALTGKCEQLKEGYSWLSKAQLKKLDAFYQDILSACDMLAQEAKINKKPRAKKPVAKEKLIAKFKYMKSNEPLKVVSINPVDIIGSNELWVYNTKTRKLGKYVAANIDPKGMARGDTGLQIKGTTIVGFDENLSIQKTLRKPDEQLKEFKAAGKVALRKFLDDIKAVDIKLNGRVNEDTLLLKIS